MDYEIEHGVKIPERGSGARKYPFPEMGIGDSFRVNDAVLGKVQAASFQYGKVHGVKFSVRKDGDGYRCWRIS